MNVCDESCLDHFRNFGFLLLPEVLNKSQCTSLNGLVTELMRHCGPEVARTTAGEVLSVFGIHLLEPSLLEIVSESALLRFVQALVGTPVYIYQSQLHLKPLSSPPLRWHQDFNAFARFDGLPEPKGVSLSYFVNEVTEHNAPIVAIPSSHRAGLLPAER